MAGRVIPRKLSLFILLAAALMLAGCDNPLHDVVKEIIKTNTTSAAMTVRIGGATLTNGGIYTFQGVLFNTTGDSVVTIGNGGTADLSFTASPGMEVSGSSMFWLDTPPGGPVPPGGSVSVTLHFKPTDSNPQTGVLKIHSNDKTNGEFSVTLSGESQKYQLTFTAGSHGTVSALYKGVPHTAGTYTVDAGVNVSLTAAADPSYAFVQWNTLSGSPVFQDTHAAVTNVTLTGGDASIQAVFAQNVFTLTLNSSTGLDSYKDGSNSTLGGTLPLQSGVQFLITAVPATGYHFVSWSAGGAASVQNAAAATTNVTLTGADGSLTANFAINTYTLTVQSGGNGTVTPATPQTVNHGANTNITATPSTGYHFVSWSASPSGNASFGNASNASTTVSLTGTATVTATFAINTYTLTVQSGGNGTVTPATPQTVNHGANTNITATANTGYMFSGWSASPSGNASFGNASLASTTVSLTGAATVTATFIEWHGTKVLDSGINSGRESSLAVSGNNLYVAYNEAGTNNVYFMMSTDKGATWSSRITIASTYALNPSLAVSGSYVYVVYYWTGTTTAEVRMAVSSNGGTSFGSTVTVDSYNYCGSGGTSVAASGNSVYVAYSNGSWSTATSTNNGTSWAKKKYSTAQSFLNPSIAVSGTYVYSVAYDQSAQDLYFTMSSDSGATWSASPALIESTGSVGSHPSVTASSSGWYVYISYYDSTNGKLMFKKNTYYGGTSYWTVLKTAASLNGSSGERTSVFFDSSKVYTAYYDNARLMLARSDDSGNTWPAGNIKNIDAMQFGCAIAVNGVYAYITYNLNGLKFARSNDSGSTW